MAYDSPFSKEIGDEWERLVFHTEPYPTATKLPPQEQVDGWKALYAKAAPNGRWAVHAMDAGLVTTLGITIAYRQDRFADAVALAEHFLTLPDADEDPVYYQWIRLELGMNLYLDGQRDRAALLLGQLITEQRPYSIRASQICCCLLQLIEDTSTPEAKPDPVIAELSANLIRTIPRHPANPSQARHARTNRRLIHILKSRARNRWADRMTKRMARMAQECADEQS